MTMPREWVRGVQWLSGHREEWGPVLRAAQDAWSELQLVSVSERLRDSALINLEAHELPLASASCARVGLSLSVLERGQDGSFRAAVHVQGLAPEWHRAWSASDHDAVGRLLRFPDCCREFFARAWVGTSDRDITPAMAAVDGPWQANTMLRWLGVRLVPHLPCSAQCPQTLENAEFYLAMGARLGIDVAALEKLLRLPVTHDALNGVLIVSTPHFRFMAGGNREPFSVSRPESRQEAAQPGPEPAPAPRESSKPQETWTDNGFGSLEAMARSHETVLSVVGTPRSALDLGAGDGRLLHSISLAGIDDNHPESHGGPWHGIEVDAGRAERGNRRHGPLVRIVPGRVENADALSGAYDVVLLMPGRLL